MNIFYHESALKRSLKGKFPVDIQVILTWLHCISQLNEYCYIRLINTISFSTTATYWQLQDFKEPQVEVWKQMHALHWGLVVWVIQIPTATNGTSWQWQTASLLMDFKCTPVFFFNLLICFCCKSVVWLTEILGQLDSAASDEVGLLLHVFPKVIQHLLHIFLQSAHWEDEWRKQTHTKYNNQYSIKQQCIRFFSPLLNYMINTFLPSLKGCERNCLFLL